MAALMVPRSSLSASEIRACGCSLAGPHIEPEGYACAYPLPVPLVSRVIPCPPCPCAELDDHRPGDWSPLPLPSPPLRCREGVPWPDAEEPCHLSDVALESARVARGRDEVCERWEEVYEEDRRREDVEA
jgi:hypothetical protein